MDPRFCLHSHQLLRYLAWLDRRSFVPGARGLLLDLNLHLLETISVLAVYYDFFILNHTQPYVPSLTVILFLMFDIKMSAVLSI